jgi:hypothetical protein
MTPSAWSDSFVNTTPKVAFDRCLALKQPFNVVFEGSVRQTLRKDGPRRGRLGGKREPEDSDDSGTSEAL